MSLTVKAGTSPASALSFQSFCAACISSMPKSTGLVLSCGDFICSRCAESFMAEIKINRNPKCPGCGKLGVKAMQLDCVVDEVAKNISDTTTYLNNMHEVLVFQLRYYKQTIKKIAAKYESVSQELIQTKRLVEQLRYGDSSATPRPFTPRSVPVSKYPYQSEILSYDHRENSQQEPESQANFHPSTYGLFTAPNEHARPSTGPGSHQSNLASIRPATTTSAQAFGGYSQQTTSSKQRPDTPCLSRLSSPIRPNSNPSPSRLRSPHLPVVRTPNKMSAQAVNSDRNLAKPLTPNNNIMR